MVYWSSNSCCNPRHLIVFFIFVFIYYSNIACTTINLKECFYLRFFFSFFFWEGGNAFMVDRDRGSHRHWHSCTIPVTANAKEWEQHQCTGRLTNAPPLSVRFCSKIMIQTKFVYWGYKLIIVVNVKNQLTLIH